MPAKSEFSRTYFLTINCDIMIGEIDELVIQKSISESFRTELSRDDPDFYYRVECQKALFRVMRANPDLWNRYLSYVIPGFLDEKFFEAVIHELESPDFVEPILEDALDLLPESYRPYFKEAIKSKSGVERTEEIRQAIRFNLNSVLITYPVRRGS
jgi:hypothetical protein